MPPWLWTSSPGRSALPFLPSICLLGGGRSPCPSCLLSLLAIGASICNDSDQACIQSTNSALGCVCANANTALNSSTLLSSARSCDEKENYTNGLLRRTCNSQPVKSKPSLTLVETSVAGGKTQSLSTNSRPINGAMTAISCSFHHPSGASAL